jgi:hypothetical protein
MNRHVFAFTAVLVALVAHADLRGQTVGRTNAGGVACTVECEDKFHPFQNTHGLQDGRIKITYRIDILTFPSGYRTNVLLDIKDAADNWNNTVDFGGNHIPYFFEKVDSGPADIIIGFGPRPVGVDSSSEAGSDWEDPTHMSGQHFVTVYPLLNGETYFDNLIGVLDHELMHHMGLSYLKLQSNACAGTDIKSLMVPMHDAQRSQVPTKVDVKAVRDAFSKTSSYCTYSGPKADEQNSPGGGTPYVNVDSGPSDPNDRDGDGTPDAQDCAPDVFEAHPGVPDYQICAIYLMYGGDVPDVNCDGQPDNYCATATGVINIHIKGSPASGVSLASGQDVVNCGNFSSSSQFMPSSATCLASCDLKGANACSWLASTGQCTAITGTNCQLQSSQAGRYGFILSAGTGRYKCGTGGTCSWDATDTGPDQCTPTNNTCSTGGGGGGGGPYPGGSTLTAGSAVRGCSGYSEGQPVFKADGDACYAYCSQSGANACEYQLSTGNCYAETGTNCHLDSGYGDWYSLVLSGAGGGSGGGGGGQTMTEGSAIRGCNGWYWGPDYEPDAASCLALCVSNGANMCEYYENGDCYTEFTNDGGCYVESGYGGWSAAVLAGGEAATPAGLWPTFFTTIGLLFGSSLMMFVSARYRSTSARGWTPACARVWRQARWVGIVIALVANSAGVGPGVRKPTRMRLPMPTKMVGAETAGLRSELPSVARVKYLR